MNSSHNKKRMTLYKFKHTTFFYKRNCDGSLFKDFEPCKSNSNDTAIYIKPYKNGEDILFYPRYNCFIVKNIDFCFIKYVKN